MSRNFPLIRLTLLGSTQSGKTSLINSYVNNGCSQQHLPTFTPQLYYRVIHVPHETDPKEPPNTVCVELEDTPPPSTEKNLPPQNSPYHMAMNTPNQFNDQTQAKFQDISVFFDMTRHKVDIERKSKNLIPFSSWRPPYTSLQNNAFSYSPLTQGRMGYMIVFDVTSLMSFESACEIYVALSTSLQSKKVRIRPYISFVANKTDLELDSQNAQQIIQMAETYTQERFLRLIRVSAWTAKNMKRAFGDLISLVVGNPILWEIDSENNNHDIKSHEDKETTETGCIQS